jgi:hypothetical protein
MSGPRRMRPGKPQPEIADDTGVPQAVASSTAAAEGTAEAVAPSSAVTPAAGVADDVANVGPCPIVALDHLDGTFIFLDAVGQLRRLSARQLSSRSEVVALFGGQLDWLRLKFPEREKDGDKVINFRLMPAATWLIAACSAAGLYGDFIKLRGPSVWRGEDGQPIVHCGDEIGPIPSRSKRSRP